MYSKWKEFENRLLKNKCIDSQHLSVINKEIHHWRSVLERLIAITLFLAKQNLAFRGSSEKLFSINAGNFLELVQLLGNFDGVMPEHLRRVSSKQCVDHYCSKRIQNELINLLGNKVLHNIQNRLKKNKYFSIILDYTPDLSHSENVIHAEICKRRK